MALPAVGVTEKSMDAFIIDSGVVFKNLTYDASEGFTGDPLGATAGGVKVDFNAKTRTIAVDGLYLTPTIGQEVYDTLEASITVSIKELSDETIRMATNGTSRAATTTEAPSGYTVVESKRWIEDGDYISNIAVSGVRRSDGANIIFVIDNALVTSPFSTDMKDKSESVVQLIFTAHSTVTQAIAGKFPWRTIYPGDSTSSGTSTTSANLTSTSAASTSALS